MPDYSTDQFYRFGDYEGKGKSIRRTRQDNPNFIWPGYGTPDVYNPIIGPQKVDTRMQRGFIRGIYPSELAKQSVSAVPQRRLFFQFNPATIDRSVQMNQMVANPLLQDPSQLFQPVPGTAGFSFELLFNREAEVVSSKYANEGERRNGRSYQISTATPISQSANSSLDSYGQSTRWDDVASLGVLADMYVLDSIIGQSITPDMVAFLKQYWQTASNVSQSYQTKGVGASVGFDATGFETNIQKNFGNSAFLSPLPIRIVFSSLFMVEGFVESSSVQFVKFTHNYVPTICRVTLGVRALYIGFAKQEAYLTTSLKTSIADSLSVQKENDAAISKAKQMVNTTTEFHFVPDGFAKRIYNNNEGKYNKDLIKWYDDDPSYTVVDWWNANVNNNNLSNEPDELLFSGKIDVFPKNGLQKRIKESGMSWTFTASLEILQKTDNEETSLAIIPLTFCKKGGNIIQTKYEDITATDVVNKVNALADAQGKEEKYSFYWKAYGKKTKEKIVNVNSTIEFKFTVEVSVFTSTGIPVSDTRSASIKSKASDTAFWKDFEQDKKSAVISPVVGRGLSTPIR